MPDPHKVTTIKRLPLIGAPTARPLAPLRPGMPSMDAIQSTMPLVPRRGGPTYRILRTTETDSYEQTEPALRLAKLLKTKKGPGSAALAAALKAKPPKGDNYAGSD